MNEVSLLSEIDKIMNEAVEVHTFNPSTWGRGRGIWVWGQFGPRYPGLLRETLSCKKSTISKKANHTPKVKASLEHVSRKLSRWPPLRRVQTTKAPNKDCATQTVAWKGYNIYCLSFQNKLPYPWMGIQRFQKGASLGIYTWQSQEPVNEEKKPDWQCMGMWGNWWGLMQLWPLNVREILWGGIRSLLLTVWGGSSDPEALGRIHVLRTAGKWDRLLLDHSENLTRAFAYLWTLQRKQNLIFSVLCVEAVG